MFLLERMKKNDRTNNSRVFVSYIRRYVLTNEFDNILVAFSGGKFSSPIFEDMFLLAKLKGAIEMSKSFRLLYSEICSYYNQGTRTTKFNKMFSSPIFGDMFLLLFDQLVDISTIIDIFNGTLNGQ